MIKFILLLVSLILSSRFCRATDKCDFIEPSRMMSVNKNINQAISKKVFNDENLKKDSLNSICSIKAFPLDIRYSYEDDWHDAHQLLGLMAFYKNDFESAKNFLIESINQGKKGAVISSFGPHGELARLLLNKGYDKEVIEYLERAISISNMKKGEASRGKMECCLEKIKKGEKCKISEAYPDHWFQVCESNLNKD